jgi:hypothetical protein
MPNNFLDLFSQLEGIRSQLSNTLLFPVLALQGWGMKCIVLLNLPVVNHHSDELHCYPEVLSSLIFGFFFLTFWSMLSAGKHAAAVPVVDNKVIWKKD